MASLKPIKAAGPAGRAFGRAKTGAKHAYQNATDSHATRESLAGGKFGRKPPTSTERLGTGAALKAPFGIMGAIYGGAAGAQASQFRHRKEIKANVNTIHANSKVMAANTRRINSVSKANAHLITDVGTAARRFRLAEDSLPRVKRKTPILSRGTKITGAAAFAGGAALTSGDGKNRIKQQQTTIKRQNNKIARQGATLSALNKSMESNMSESAFGVEHGDEVSKAGSDNGNKYSTGRAVSATMLGVYHAPFAAKKGKKLRATGRVAGEAIGGGIGGTVAGGAIGAVTRNPKAVRAGARVGSAVGSTAGSYHGFRSNNKKGYYKPQKNK